MAVGVSTQVASAGESVGSEGADSITLPAALMAGVLATEVVLGVGSDSMVVIPTTATVVTLMTTMDAFTRTSESHLLRRV